MFPMTTTGVRSYPIDSSKLCYKDVCKTDLNILHDNFKAWKSTAYQRLAHRPSVDESISLFGDILDQQSKDKNCRTNAQLTNQ